MREFGLGAVRSGMLERGPGDAVGPRRWVLRGGVSNSMAGAQCTRRGSPLTGPRLRAATPFSAFS